MPKKRTPRQRKAAAEQARQERRLASDAARRDEHARLVVERQGDPRFTQRLTTETGAVVSWEAGTPMDSQMREAVGAQTRLFREKFGRDPGPDDPLFFDPDAEQPMALTKETWDAELGDLAQHVGETGVDPAYIYAWRDVGYIVTEDTQHLFSATEVEAFENAVTRHRGEGPDADENG